MGGNRVDKSIVILILAVIMFITPGVVSADDLAGKRICIDPGHGGYDPGATRDGLEEEDVNLDIALKLKELLTAEGAVPILTRETDINPAHKQRWETSQNNNCDIFIAIHCNSNDKTTPSGTEVYYYPKEGTSNGDAAKSLANQVYGEVTSHLDTAGNRIGPIRYAYGTRSYWVLGADQFTGITQTPAINIELAFISNSDDRQKLASPEYQQESATAILHGLQLYYGGTPQELQAPNKPTDLIQYKSDGITGILLGDTTTENIIIMTGGVSDPGGNSVQLEVEVKPVNTEFTGTSTFLSPLVASGSTASVTYTGLSDGVYKWRARAKNSNGATGFWQDAGGNAENDPDFKVSIAQASPVTLIVSPSSGRQGTIFTFNGNGYTPNGAIEFHVRKPDNTEFPAAILTASSSGVLSYSYQSTTASPVGTYTIWAIDKTTGRQSNNVQETINRTSMHLK